MRNLRISLQKLVILCLIVSNTLGMEMTRNNTRPQGQYSDIGAAQFITQRICEALLRSLVGMVDRFTGKRWYFEACDGGHIDDCPGLAGEHRSVQDRVSYEHWTIDVRRVHGQDF